MKPVIDASVLLAVLFGETNDDGLLLSLQDGNLSTVNMTEVQTRANDRGIDSEHAARFLERLRLQMHVFDVGQATIVADLRPATRHLGLSLGDRACLALARSLGAPVMTADRAWASLDVGIDITVIR